MRRDVTFEEISDGKRYHLEDMAKISCNGCVGCSECCKFTDDTIFLDPYDIYELSKGLSKSFEDMLESIVGLTVVDGVITPYLMKGANGACVFLNNQGLCNIHTFRPGFCRLFPLGRIYNDDETFDYFIQVHECPYPAKSKIKISKWLGIPRPEVYESFVIRWHELIKNISECASEDPASPMIKAANMKMLNTFFVINYDHEKDFYEQFNERTGLYMA